MRHPSGSTLLATPGERVVVADAAMGTMVRVHDLSPENVWGLEGCEEILDVSRPGVVPGAHDAYLAAGCDLVETNIFGANHANLGEYGIIGRIGEPAEAGAPLARQVTDDRSTPDRPRLVIGSVGPGTRPPALGHAPHAVLGEELRFADGRTAAGRDSAEITDCFQLGYRGARFSLGHRACPDLEDRARIAAPVERERIGITLSEEFQPHPGQSTDAIVVHHPEATSFNA